MEIIITTIIKILVVVTEELKKKKKKKTEENEHRKSKDLLGNDLKEVFPNFSEQMKRKLTVAQSNEASN